MSARCRNEVGQNASQLIKSRELVKRTLGAFTVAADAAVAVAAAAG